jgi:hypothetical protein
MHPPVHLDTAEPNQDLFWAYRCNGAIGHAGGNIGLTSFLFFDPVTQVGKLFVANTEPHEGPRSLAQFKAIKDSHRKYQLQRRQILNDEKQRKKSELSCPKRPRRSHEVGIKGENCPAICPTKRKKLPQRDAERGV